MKHIAISILIILFSLSLTAKENKAAVVISKTSYRNYSENVAGGAKAWTAVMNLAGVPYSCLFIEDLEKENIADYSSVVFSQCLYLSQNEYQITEKAIKKLCASRSGIVIDGPVGIFDENGNERNSKSIDDFLKIVQGETISNDNFRLSVSDNRHYITSPYTRGEYVSHYLTSESEIFSFSDPYSTIVEISDDRQAYPYLSVKEIDNSRVALFGGLSSSAGIGKSFSNYNPKGFFDSKVYPLLVRLINWNMYGDIRTPFPSLLLTDASMTAIIRLDGDGSHSPASMDLCMNYLLDIAEESGVQTVMSFVSSWGTRGGWEHYAPLAKKMKESGSEIGTHSRTHTLSELTDEEGFNYELDGSKKEIREGLSGAGFDPGEIRFLINPGDGLSFDKYHEVADRFEMFMTHGMDQSLPIAYGNISWFMGGKRMPVINDSPSPDYQWFYDSSWSYTTPEVALYEGSVLEHLFSTVGNGVIFDAMWHDYGMSTYLAAEPRNVTKIIREGTRIINKSNRQYYDVVRNFFNTHDIYCPEPEELSGKMQLLSTASISWNYKNDALRTDLVFDSRIFSKYGKYIGGMAIGTNSCREISSVKINSKPYFAFSKDKIILPNPTGTKMKIEVFFSEEKIDSPRLTYISKNLESISLEKECLKVTVNNHSIARFEFVTPTPSVILNSDSFEASPLCGTLRGRLSGRGTITVVPVKVEGISVLSSSLPFTSMSNGKNSISINVADNGNGENVIVIASGDKISVTSSLNISIQEEEGKTTVHLKKFEGNGTITINKEQ